MSCDVDVGTTGETRNTYGSSERISESNTKLRSYRFRTKGNIKMGVRKTRVRSSRTGPNDRFFVNTAMNLRVRNSLSCTSVRKGFMGIVSLQEVL
jgi:hypothetical protein